MKKVKLKQGGRDKAFLGAIVGQVAGMVGGAISAKKKRKAEEKAFNIQQTEQVRLDGINQAAAMSAVYGNQEYVDDYQNKITLKNGGKVKFKKGGFVDRISRDKKFAVGGREKKFLGSLIGKDGIGGEVSGAAGGLMGLAGSLLNKPQVDKTIKKSDGFTLNVPKTTLAANSYQTDANGLPVSSITNINGANVLNTDSELVKPRVPLARMGKLTKRSLKSGL